MVSSEFYLQLTQFISTIFQWNLIAPIFVIICVWSLINIIRSAIY